MIGEFLRARLKTLEMSQADLARALTLRKHHVTRANVSHWINGRNDPPLEDEYFRSALALSLDMDVNDLMVQIGYGKLDSQRSPEARRAADLMDLLPDDVKGLALEQLDALVKRYAKPPRDASAE